MPSVCLQEVNVSKKARKLLKALQDDLWHYELPKKVDPKTIDWCIEMGYARTRRIFINKRPDYQDFITVLRITRRGRIALKKET